MYSIHRLLPLALILFFTLPMLAQQTTVYTEAEKSYKRGLDFYESGTFGLALKEFEKTIRLTKPLNQPELEAIRTDAELHYAKCAVRLDWPNGEKLILDFARNNDPDPVANEAVVEMADFYYNDRQYDKAAELYGQIDVYDLTKEQRSEVKFKQGYSLFVKKKFKEAKAAFNEIKDLENDYYYHTNYYLGMVHFFEDNYPAAITSFKVAEKDKKYKAHVPYYITQIYFSKGNYDEVINYGKPFLRDSKVRKRAEISQLVGQAYFERGDYRQAMPYLEAYAEQGKNLREEDLYQLGFVQYHTGNCAKAVSNFETLSRTNSAMGQNAMYLLGDCSIKNNDKSKAMVAFRNAAKLNFDPEIKEEAQYNYAKLAYELKYDREAVTALQSIPVNSPRYSEAQTMLSNIFLNTRDYERALKTLDGIKNKTPQMRETYQKVAYLRGVQLTKDGMANLAKNYFNKSLQHPVNTRTKALTYYWLGEIAHQEGKFQESIREMNKFIAVAKTTSNLPDEASMHTANYIQGYNYLKLKKYKSAQDFFVTTAKGLKTNAMYIGNETVRGDILADATLRAGDMLFKRKQYRDATKYYDEAINRKYKNYVYGLYQKAIIMGLQRKPTDKLIALEYIIDEFPKSQYADDALLQLGTTYMEIGKMNQASTPLKRLVRDYKGKSDLINQALLKLGLISYNQGSPETAINYYKQIFSNNPTAKEGQAALTALEEIYVDDLGRADDYFAFLETIPGYKVEDAEKEAISFKAAESKFENAQYDKAIIGYGTYLSKYPNGRYAIDALYHRGESYSVLKQYSNALLDYDAVVKKGSSRYYAKALEKAALIAYNHEQNFGQAYELYVQLEQAAQDDETRYEAQLGAMRAAYRNNNPQAVATFANKVRDNTNASEQQRATANFYLGKQYLDQKSYDLALAAFNEVTKLSNDEQAAEARYDVAYIYYVRRELEVAEQLCLNANAESSDYPYWIAKSIILLSDILAEKGDLFNAQAALEGLIENYDEDAELVAQAKAKLAQLRAREAAGSPIRAPLVPDGPPSDLLELEEPENNR